MGGEGGFSHVYPATRRAGIEHFVPCAIRAANLARTLFDFETVHEKRQPGGRFREMIGCLGIWLFETSHLFQTFKLFKPL
jgi:hypothetical protein